MASKKRATKMRTTKKKRTTKKRTAKRKVVAKATLPKNAETEKYVFGPFPHATDPGFVRADLEFYGIDHYRPSYVVRVYLNDTKVEPETATEDRPSYAGTVAIFGHCDLEILEAPLELALQTRVVFDNQQPVFAFTHGLSILPQPFAPPAPVQGCRPAAALS